MRFIEFMPLDAEGEWTTDQRGAGRRRSSSGSTRSSRSPTRPCRARPPATSSRPSGSGIADGIGDVGVIASVTAPFCEQCDRIRVTAEGKLRTCLFALDEFDLRAILRDEARRDRPTAVDDRLAAEIERAVGTKWAGHRIGQVDFVRPAAR